MLYIERDAKVSQFLPHTCDATVLTCTFFVIEAPLYNVLVLPVGSGGGQRFNFEPSAKHDIDVYIDSTYARQVLELRLNRCFSHPSSQLSSSL